MPSNSVKLAMYTHQIRWRSSIKCFLSKVAASMQCFHDLCKIITGLHRDFQSVLCPELLDVSSLPSYKKLSVVDHTASICVNTFHNLLLQITRSTVTNLHSSPCVHVNWCELSRRVQNAAESTWPAGHQGWLWGHPSRDLFSNASRQETRGERLPFGSDSHGRLGNPM